MFSERSDSVCSECGSGNLETDDSSYWYCPDCGLDVKRVLVLCKSCHFAAESGRVLCEKCKIRYKDPRYETCYQCKMELEEANDPVAQKIREIFLISSQEAWERHMEAECIQCGGWTWEEVEQYNVYLFENGSCVGVLCKECYKIFQEIENPKFLVKQA